MREIHACTGQKTSCAVEWMRADGYAASWFRDVGKSRPMGSWL